MKHVLKTLTGWVGVKASNLMQRHIPLFIPVPPSFRIAEGPYGIAEVAMPVALRKRSWEDHVTPHWGTRYSYDDLDLICWHGVVDGGGPSAGPRERCASMPECRRRRPAVGSRTEAGGDDDEGAVGDNGSWRERTFSCGLTGTTGQSGNKETGNVSGAESLPTMTDQDMHQSAESSAGHGSVGSLSASTSNDIPGEGHRNGTEMEDEWPFPDTLPTSEPSSPNVEGCGTDGTRPDIGSADRAEASGTEPIPEEGVVIRAQGSPETKLTKLGDSEDDHVGGPVDAAGADADLTGEDRSSERLDPSQVSKTSVAPDVSFPNPAAQSSGVACHSRNVDRLDAGGPLAKTRDFGASSDHEAPPCLSGSDPKLNPILEISLTESEKEAPGHVMAVAFLEPEGIRNGAAAMHTPQGSSGLLAEQGLLGNSQNNKVAELTPVWESLLDCASETVQSDAPGHQATPNMDRSDEVERNKPQESPVRLWARKSSREEREMARCRLDSMVLLIMKLDQLDQEIESALSSAPSHDGTPTLKRRIISVSSQSTSRDEPLGNSHVSATFNVSPVLSLKQQADVASLDGDGSPSGSAHSLNTHHHHHQPSSSQSSTELGGAKPGMAVSAASMLSWEYRSTSCNHGRVRQCDHGHTEPSSDLPRARTYWCKHLTAEWEDWEVWDPSIRDTVVCDPEHVCDEMHWCSSVILIPGSLHTGHSYQCGRKDKQRQTEIKRERIGFPVPALEHPWSDPTLTQIGSRDNPAVLTAALTAARGTPPGIPRKIRLCRHESGHRSQPWARELREEAGLAREAFYAFQECDERSEHLGASIAFATSVCQTGRGSGRPVDGGVEKSAWQDGRIVSAPFRTSRPTKTTVGRALNEAVGRRATDASGRLSAPPFFVTVTNVTPRAGLRTRCRDPAQTLLTLSRSRGYSRHAQLPWRGRTGGSCARRPGRTTGVGWGGVKARMSDGRASDLVSESSSKALAASQASKLACDLWHLSQRLHGQSVLRTNQQAARSAAPSHFEDSRGEVSRHDTSRETVAPHEPDWPACVSVAFNTRSLKETEAKEACSWLRAAGFPQYAQLYEDGEFPIEIPSVTRDHDFLDRDAIEALCRRLNTLNKCALMRLEITPQRKRSEDSDEDEPCAISGRWTFQRESKRWSRLDLDVFYPPAGGAAPDQECLVRDGLDTSAESVLTDVSECPDGGSSRGGGVSLGPAPTGSAASVCSSGTSDGPPSPPALGHFPFEAGSVPAGGGGAKSTRSRAKSFLKRMESLRLRSSSGVVGAGRQRRTGLAGAGRPEISAPEPKEGLDEDALRRFNCVDIEGQGRATCYSTQTSSGSAGSSQSETSSGSAVSTPSPVSRARSHSAAAGAAKRAGMYLEGFDPFSLVLVQEGVGLDNRRRGRRAEPSTTAENNQRNLCWPDEQQGVDEAQGQGQEGRVIYFYLPEGHKPGTFPKALANSGPCCRGDGTDYRAPRRVSSTSLDSRLSFYDNVPFPEMGGEEEEEEEEEPQGVGEEPKIGEVLDRGRGLRQLVSAWSSRGHEEEDEEGDSDSALDSASPCPSSPLQNRLEEENASDPESTGNATRDRRDSGMGPSLTLNNRPQKLRWPSFQSSHRPSGSSSHLQVGCQSVQQMNLLRKYSLLKITALLEKHTPASKHGFSWAVPKFMKRMKVRDMRGRSVFGVPLQVNVQRSGQPLPQGIQHAMRYLRQQCLDQVGLFRKSGVKSRIQALRQMNESCGTDGGGVSYEGQSAYDVADMLKQYFRDLPEPLLTSKLSDTFLQIYQFVPKELRLQAVRAAVLLLPDDKREVLQTLLCFLGDVTANASENQMTCTNLAVCLAPSLFHLNTARRDASSPRVMSRKNALGKPDQKDLNENLAATHCLAHMIQECRKLFQIPEELSCCRKSYMEQSLSPCRMEDLLEVHGSRGYRGLVQGSLDALLKEAKDRFRGYDSCSTHEHAIELAYKKVHDGWSLRQWKVCTEVGAGPEDVLRRIAGEQSSWDEDLLESRVVESLEHSADVYQYVRNSMAPHPPTDHVVLRLWVTDLPKGACALVCVSVDHEGAAVLGVRANVLTSRYYIEPCGPNKSRITHISRIDYRGRCPEWYNKMYGHLCASELVRIRDSFICPLDK
ncbi:hypothetical protein P4O66_012416 [Electrophorus voltai]|uniref:Rho GTPase-activating protein 7 n=1 Tax=Electrophorus voltai TaxID=2609070 RepID=A0AAD9DSK3_9TELE|nr:hypothetical protein P4O66_012416 [Electrophorus voltai]